MSGVDGGDPDPKVNRSESRQAHETEPAGRDRTTARGRAVRTRPAALAVTAMGGERSERDPERALRGRQRDPGCDGLRARLPLGASGKPFPRD